MTITILNRIVGSFTLSLLLMFASAHAAAASPTLLQAKNEAEAKGYTLITSRDDIIAKAKKEGNLQAVVNMDPANIKASAEAFRKRYPFINLQIVETTGTDGAQRLFLEVSAGRSKQWDVVHIAKEFWSQYLPYLLKIDILAMAQQGVLQIPPPMIDPINRNILAFSSRFNVTVYNKNLVPANQIPKTWEDLLKPELKGKKFAVDIRPTEVAALVPAWGLEKTLDFARRIKEQDPIWVRGGTRTMTAILAGEVPMLMGPNFHSMKELEVKDRTGVLKYVILEPVPLRFGNEQVILTTAQHPHAALLWLEWMASAEAQKITDEQEPLASSIYMRGGVVERELRGKKLSTVGWEHYQHIDQWYAKVVEAYGFPKADAKR
ncbi:MAG: ABC transporter substrate-binding protein [Candidatus Binatia bacterium]